MAQNIRSLAAFVPISTYLVIVSWASITWNEHYHTERSFQYAILVLIVAGAVLSGLSRTPVLSKLGQPEDQKNQGKKDDESHVGLLSGENAEVIELNLRDWRSFLSKGSKSDTRSLQSMSWNAVVLSAAVLGRSILLRKVSMSQQCTVNDLEKTILPIIFALHDYVQNSYRKTEEDERDTISNSFFEDAYDFIKFSRVRYLPLTALLVVGLRYIGPPGYTSTAMCAGVSGQKQFTILLQILGIALDMFLIIRSWHALKFVQSEIVGVKLLGVLCLTVAGLLITTSTLYLFLHPSSITSAFSTPSTFKTGSVVDGIALALGLFCLNYLFRDFRPFALVFITTVFAVLAPILRHALDDRKSFPPQRRTRKVVGLFMIIFTFLLFQIIYRSAETVAGKPNILRRIHFAWNIVMIGGLIFGTTGFLMTKGWVGFHPVKLMMYQAKSEAARWNVEASSSNSLPVAVKEYAARYHRLPPPHFDKWFHFAKDRGSIVIDSYDQIVEDLMPFWGIEPSEIRKASVSKGPGFSTVRINWEGTNGVTSHPPVPNVPLIDLIKSFSDFLPPMQIVINTGYEPQVSIPNSHLRSLESKVQKSLKQSRPIANNNWTVPAGSGWPGELPDLESFILKGSPPLLPLSRWDAYVQPACKFSTHARRHPYNSDKLCTRCITPHSINQFMHNVSKSLDVCQQPDIHKLSYFLASPATAPRSGYPASQLVPIFSSRKMKGFNDILFPYQGSYIEKDAPKLNHQTLFENKDDILFWLGDRPVTSLSDQLRTRSWQSQTEFRLVQLVNKPGVEKIPFFLPLDKKAKNPKFVKFMNAYVPLAALKGQIRITANFSTAPDEVECSPNPTECKLQDDFFGLHNDRKSRRGDELRFAHRYLLTLDSDPSAQFIRDVSSNSVAVRGSIFKEWWDGRLTPWLHYIPIDIRLHGLHATFAYYMGLRGLVKDKEVVIERREDDAKWIAEEGRKRVNEAMRQADAEVYMFRLLLEWARVVDDDRDSLGYTG